MKYYEIDYSSFFDKEIYLNYVNGIEGYKIEPLIFKNQKTNLAQYLIKLD